MSTKPTDETRRTVQRRDRYRCAICDRETGSHWSGDSIHHREPRSHPFDRLHHRKLDLTSFRLADQAIGGNPYQNHAGTHRVQDCIRRDINDYTAYLDIIRTGTQGDRQ